MRTVSFSNDKVRDLLNGEFVNTFSNTTGDPTAGKSIWHDPSDSPGMCIRGNGKQNVQTLFLTPQGKIFHAATGYLSADDLVDEIEFAQNLFSEIKGTPGSAKNLVRDAHQDRLKELGNGKEIVPAGIIGEAFHGLVAGQLQSDQKFCADNPLMSYREFEKDPGKLVGHGKSSFVSTSSNNTGK